MNTNQVVAEKARKRQERINRRRAALVRAARKDVQILKQIIRGEQPKQEAAKP